MTVRITSEGRRVAAILGYLQPLRLRPAEGEDPEHGWVTATCRMRSVSSMAVEVLALGPHVEVVAPPELRAYVTALVRRTGRLYR
jgi:predicted DNA-binding transcriptional regulator YafY